MPKAYCTSINSPFVFALVVIMLGPNAAQAGRGRQASVGPPSIGLTPQELERKTELQNRLCSQPRLKCEYVKSVFSDPRMVLYEPPPPAPEHPATKPQRERERNPYLTDRFALLSPDSLERCRSFIGSHQEAFDTAYQKFGVPAEIICGHLRIETDFGIPTKLSPNPMGKRPAINQLVSLYARNPSLNGQRRNTFIHRQRFAFTETSNLIAAGTVLGWDLFGVPGSSTGAIGLTQFEPSSFSVGVDGDGDGRIDLFNPDDAIVSVAHYLVTRGWDNNPEHQHRAVYAYYGGHYDHDPRKYYMKAVFKYANSVRDYLKEHPIERASS